MTRVQLTVNGKARSAEIEPRTSLVEWLRDELGLTGTHIGCHTSQCGACTVHMDGRAVKSCSVLAVQAEGSKLTTIEGLADATGRLHPLQQAFIDCHGLQCGYCTPGMIMAAAELLAREAAPTDQQIMAALEGNFCRCTGYVNIIAAVRNAAGVLAAR
jgi:aerobic carbon-monoxide dehydrogenase small subunit